MDDHSKHLNDLWALEYVQHDNMVTIQMTVCCALSQSVGEEEGNENDIEDLREYIGESIGSKVL